MEYFIGLIGVEEIEGECNEYILDLSDDLWEGLAHCKKYNQFPWDIVEWLLGSGIQFSLKAYTIYDDNKSYDFKFFLNFCIGIPASPQDYIAWFVNIPNDTDAMRYKLMFPPSDVRNWLCNAF